MLIVATLVIMALVGYFYTREGLFTAFLMFVNVLIAGLITFNFWEPLANVTEPLFRTNFMRGSEDLLAIVLIFTITLGVLRLFTRKLNDEQIAFPAGMQQFGGLLFGLLTGYLVSGLLVVALQTLPWGQHFLDFEPPLENDSGLRSYLPPDRVWLALMHRAGTHSFNRADVPEADRHPELDTDDPADTYLTFDRFGAFELLYLHRRRTPDR
jgi:hypothetical protein